MAVFQRDCGESIRWSGPVWLRGGSVIRQNNVQNNSELAAEDPAESGETAIGRCVARLDSAVGFENVEGGHGFKAARCLVQVATKKKEEKKKSHEEPKGAVSVVKCAVNNVTLQHLCQRCV